MISSRFLLIDAYNVICAVEGLRVLMQSDLDTARDQLAEVARAIHDAEGVRVALILDSKNDKLTVDHPYKTKTFEYLYAPSALTADGVIERIVQRVKNANEVSVVSNDNMVREATRASGAMALRPEELYEWSRACEVRLRQDTSRRNRSNARGFKNGLDFELEL